MEKFNANLLSSHCKIMSSNQLSRSEQLRDVQEKRAATSMQQTAEWGMRGLLASFPCLKDQFAYEERGEQRITLKLFVLLFILHARMVGINQICNAYIPFLNWNANAEYLV